MRIQNIQKTCQYIGTLLCDLQNAPSFLGVLVKRAQPLMLMVVTLVVVVLKAWNCASLDRVWFSEGYRVVEVWALSNVFLVGSLRNDGFLWLFGLSW